MSQEAGEAFLKLMGLRTAFLTVAGRSNFDLETPLKTMSYLE